ncbi:MAG TPA: DUF1800 domain-containing protein [Actinocrinis sp.]|nr:DUF1800 domain-containing protein [Actinocrinis sp.]
MNGTDGERALIGQLLRRSGFGASGAEIDAAVADGYQATVDGLFAPVTDPGADATPAPTGLVDPTPTGTSAAAKKAANQQRTAQGYDLLAWWIARMTAARRPWAEKRTFFWHGHFATAISKVRSAPMMLAQNQTMRQLGGGDFHTLMRAMFTDPAMMVWLDAEGNTAKAPNENLARESMELFALGVGNYTENDVRAAALALTGWKLDRLGATAVFEPRAHAPGPETILGKSADYDVDSFTDLLLAQPANARFVAARMWFRLGSSAPIPADTLGRLVSAYGPQWDLAALARAVFTDPRFTSGSTTDTRYALVKQPTEYVVGTLRALRITPPASGADKKSAILRSALNGLGQMPFDPPNVGGWPSGQFWLTTAAIQSRITFADWAVQNGDISAVSDAAASARIDAAAHLLGVDAFSDRTRSALSDVAADPRQLVTLALLSPEYQVN